MVRVRRLIAGLGLAVMLPLVLNDSGLARYPGGPLSNGGLEGAPWLQFGQPPVIVSTVIPTASLAAGTHAYLLEGPVQMQWPVDPIVERVEPVWQGAAPLVSGVLIRTIDSGVSGAVTIEQNSGFVMRGTTGVFAPAPVRIHTRNCCEPEEQFVIKIDGGQTGSFVLAGMWVDYRAGPFTFHTFVVSGDAFELR